MNLPAKDNLCHMSSDFIASVREVMSTSFQSNTVCSNDDNMGIGARCLTKPKKSIVRLQTKINSFRNLKTKTAEADQHRRPSLRKSLQDLFSSRSKIFPDEDANIGFNKQVDASVDKKSVRFDSVSYRVYDVYVDDHPAVSKGPAIALSGWTFQKEGTVHINEYEQDRPYPRRAFKELKLSPSEREEMLRDSGVTKRELMAYMKQSNIAKRKRAATLERTRHGLPEEEMEEFFYSVKRLFRLEKSTEEEIQNLWNHANPNSTS